MYHYHGSRACPTTLGIIIETTQYIYSCTRYIDTYALKAALRTVLTRVNIPVIRYGLMTFLLVLVSFANVCVSHETYACVRAAAVKNPPHIALSFHFVTSSPEEYQLIG